MTIKRARRPWLPCPVCGSQDSEVVEVCKRVGDRRRRCKNCGEEFRTTESVVRRNTGIASPEFSPESVLRAIHSTPFRYDPNAQFK